MLGRIVGLGADPYRKGLAWAVGASVLFHLAVVAALLWTPSSEARQIGGGDGILDAEVFFSDALPGGPAAPPPPPPPQVKPEPVRAAPAPAPKPPDVVIPDEKQAKPKEAPKPVEKAKDDKKAEKPPQKEKEKPKEAEQSYADTLAKIQKMRAERATELGGGGGAGKGRPGPPGPGGLASTICDLQLGNYQVEAVGKIQSLIAYPDANRALAAEVGVQISKSGRVLKRWVETKSGDRLFDDAVAAAVEKANPLPPLPQCLGVDPFEVVLVFKPAAGAP